MSRGFNRTCVVYHFFDSGPEARKNLEHLFDFGYRADLDFYLVIAGQAPEGIPSAANISVREIENRNLDFGGYGHAITSVVPVDRYDDFIFLNSSVRGPFMPAYVGSWTAPFLSQLVGDVGIVGSTINILSPTQEFSVLYQEKFGGTPPFSHLQTMCFAVGRPVLKRLIAENFFEIGAPLTKPEVIVNAELRLSRRILEWGYNLKCLIPRYNEVDYRRPHTDINPTSVNGDTVFPGAFFGRTLHPFETIFTKTNRGLHTEQFLDSLATNCRPGEEILSPGPIEFSVGAPGSLPDWGSIARYSSGL